MPTGNARTWLAKKITKSKQQAASYKFTDLANDWITSTPGGLISTSLDENKAYKSNYMYKFSISDNIIEFYTIDDAGVERRHLTADKASGASLLGRSLATRRITSEAGVAFGPEPPTT
jgi:hypothetical protein